MTTSQTSDVLAFLHRAVLPQERADLTDGQLLHDFVNGRDTGALAVLVRRHGAMVWGVCRRILHSPHDAEDAFQATFLVLVRKAASIASRELVANWLYKVAYQTARKARATTAKRSEREKQVVELPEAEFIPDDLWHDLQPLLDHELSRLPDKYRVPIVLCDLEGKTRKEAAQQLRCPEGTVAGRLARARALLAKRLTRHPGLTELSAIALAVLLDQNAASAKPPLSVTSSTIKAASSFAAGHTAAGGLFSAKAVALAQGVVNAMLLTKLKIATVALAVIVLLGGGVAALTQNRSAEKTSLGAMQTPRAQKATEPPVKNKNEPVAQTALKKKEAEPLPTNVNGVAKAVDAANNKVTVAYGPSETIFTLPADAKIEIDGKPSQLAYLPVGANVSLGQFVDATTARILTASGRSYFGNPLRSVTAESNTITIDDNREGTKTLSVAPDACISVDGKNCKLAAVPAGAFVNLGLAVDQQTVRFLGAQGPHLGDCGGSPVKAVNPTDSTITFDDKANSTIAGKTFSVSPNANISIDGKAGKLYDLPAGSYVNCTLSVDQQLVLQLNGQGPPLDCDCGGSAIRSVDPVINTITFDDNTRASVAGKTFPIAKDALLVVDGRSGTLAEIPPGACVSARFRVDKTTIGTIRASGSAFAGVIKLIDTMNHSITVAESTYPVAKDALIMINGKECPLSAMPTGSNANINLRVDQKTVGMIQLRTE